MAAPGNSGFLFVLQVQDPVTLAYSTLGGLQSKDYSVNGEVVDATTHGSNQWKQSIDGAGVTSFKVAGSGIHDGTHLLNVLEDACINRTSALIKLIDQTSGTGIRTYAMSARVSDFKRSAKFNGAQDYSVTLESNGAVTTTST